MCLRGGVMVPKWDAEYSASISLLQQTFSGLIRKHAMQKPSGVSQINLSSPSEKATRVFAQQTFGQLCIPNKSLAILSDISQPDKKKQEGWSKEKRKGFGICYDNIKNWFLLSCSQIWCLLSGTRYLFPHPAVLLAYVMTPCHVRWQETKRDIEVIGSGLLKYLQK